MTALAVACGGGGNKAAPTVAIGTVAPVATPSTSSAGADKPTPVPTSQGAPTPPASLPVTGAEAVSVQTPDGVLIKGNLFSAAGPKRRILVIASAVPDTEAAWQDFARELAGAGVATLTFQMPQYKDTGTARDVALMDKDLELVVAFVESRDYPLVYVLGARSAGIAALKLAARHKLAGVITVSAPLGVGVPGAPFYDAKADIPKIMGPKLFIASNDATGSADANALAQGAADPKQVKIFNSGGPILAAGLLRAPDAVAFKQAIKDFVSK